MRTPLYVIFGLALALAAPASALDDEYDPPLKIINDFHEDEAAAISAYEGESLFISNAIVERVVKIGIYTYLVRQNVPEAERGKVPPGAKGIPLRHLH
jgi:hypothetical protein